MSNIAVVGCGRWGKNLVRNLAALGALRVVCDTDAARLAGLRDEYPDTRPTTSYHEVLSDPDIQAVVIATPAAAHYDHAREALEAGKDVLVEKPLAMTVGWPIPRYSG